MINIQICKKDNNIISVFCEGHANYEDKGKDIVCAGVSVLVQNAILSLEQLVGLKLNAVIDEKNAVIKFEVPTNLKKDQHNNSQLILKSMLIGLKDMQNSYKKFIKLKEKMI